MFKKIKIISKVFQSMILSLILLIMPLTTTVSATNGFYSGNDILFYNERANTAPCASTGDGSIVGKVWSFFISKELTEIQTAGILGNIYQESSVSPTAWQTINAEDKTSNAGILTDNKDSDHAWGIVQWDGSRRYSENSDGTKSGILGKLLTDKPHLEKYISSSYSTGGAEIIGTVKDGFKLTDKAPLSEKNIPEEDLNELLTFELEYVWAEMPNEYNYTAKDNVSALDKIKTANTVLDATIIFHDYFERSSDSDEFVKNTRGGYAQAIYDKMSGMSAGKSCGSGNKFIDTLKSYVWPTHRGWYNNPNVSADKNTGIQAVTPTDGYKKAVEKATSEGRYDGDECTSLGVGSGIDCGAFVTTFIYDSGWDTGYNYNGTGGATATQKQWLDANWQNLGNAASIDTSTLRPGDVAIYSDGDDGHTFVYIGNVDGYESTVASASQCQRAPMSGSESLNDSEYTWYRKK